MKGYELFLKAKERGGYRTDYELCKAMDITMQKVNNWKNERSNPSTVTSLKLMKIGNIGVEEGLKILEGGYARVSLLAMTAMVSSAVMLASSGALNDLLYIIRNRKVQNKRPSYRSKIYRNLGLNFGQYPT